MCVCVCVSVFFLFFFVFGGGCFLFLFYVIVDVWQNFQLGSRGGGGGGDAKVCSCLRFAVLASHCHECTLPVPSPLVDWL